MSKAQNPGQLATEDPIIEDEFAAQGGSFDLGARDETWDAGAAEKSYDLPADADCYLWAESGGDKAVKATFKFPFVSKTGGKHAVWGAITAATQRLDSADIPDGDKAGIRSKIEAYYAKARTKYKDDTIQVPWKKSGASIEEPDWAALAELAGDPPDLTPAEALIAAAGLTDESPIQTTYELTEGGMAQRAFYAAVIAEGLDAQTFGEWPCEITLPDDLEPAVAVLARSDNQAAVCLADGTAALVYSGHGWFTITAAAKDRKAASAAVNAFRAAYPATFARPNDPDVTTVPITFWSDGKYGPSRRLRMIDAATWADVESNYTAAVRDELARITGDDFEPGAGGQLMLWQGPPGTGKTWALRALATEWRDWAEFSYITDPDAFFVHNPSYMIDVLLHESYEAMTLDGDIVTEGQPEGKWRVLILEDTGELLAATAKSEQGQGLSRLLNVVDGMVGQGLRVLVIVTTNDELGDMHPAAVRPGRCASQVVFGPLTAEESAAWMQGRSGSDVEFVMESAHTLAELYAGLGEAADAFQDAPAEDGPDRQPMEGPCANCEHGAGQHDGEYNDGSCMAADCACEQFEPQDEPDADDTAALEAAPFTVEDGWLVLHTTTPHMPQVESLPSPNGDDLALQNVTLAFENFTITSTTGNALHVTEADGFADLIALFADDAPVIAPPAELPGGTITWEAVLAPVTRPTDDGRVFAPNAITWRELPLTLMGMVETEKGHDGAAVCGRIDRIWYDEAAQVIRGAGEFDNAGDFGAEIARLVDAKILRGISVDLAVDEVAVLPRDQVIDADGNWIGPVGGTARAEQEEDGGPTLVEVLLDSQGEDMLYVILSAVIGAATVCPFQAFREAIIETGSSLVASVQSPLLYTQTADAGFRLAAERRAAVPADGVGTLTASAAGIAPTAPPHEWFDNPALEELTPLTVDEDGRVYGHAAPWDECHLGIPGICTTAPSSASDYAYFHLKEVLCDDGARVACGTITLDAGHADTNLGRKDTTRHYDHTGTAVADIVVGEDEFGIWVAGALRGDVDEDTARKLRGAALSGDWRDVNGGMELVALLCVNVPGFPVPRPRVLVASGVDGAHLMTLQTAWVPGDEQSTTPGLSEIEAARFAGLLALAG